MPTKGRVDGAQSKERKPHFLNVPLRGEPAGASKDAARAEFARRLKARLTEKGWNQSELARQAALHMPDGKFGRDSVSGYVRGENIPTPLHLAALAKALGVKPSDLVPSRGMRSVNAAYSSPDICSPDICAVDGDRVFLRINQVVARSTALKILQLIEDERAK